MLYLDPLLNNSKSGLFFTIVTNYINFKTKILQLFKLIFKILI